MDINKRTSELLINKMLNAQNPNSKSSDFASKMDQRGVEPFRQTLVSLDFTGFPMYYFVLTTL